MAYHPFVLRAPTTDTEWPAAGSPVFALKIDDERLEYWDPNSQRDNVLRTLLVKAFMAQGVPVEQAKANASNLITEAIEEVSITAWRAKIMGPFDSDASFQNRQLNRFVKTVSTDAQRYDFLANYDFVFLGVSPASSRRLALSRTDLCSAGGRQEHGAPQAQGHVLPRQDLAGAVYGRRRDDCHFSAPFVAGVRTKVAGWLHVRGRNYAVVGRLRRRAGGGTDPGQLARRQRLPAGQDSAGKTTAHAYAPRLQLHQAPPLTVFIVGTGGL